MFLHSENKFFPIILLITFAAMFAALKFLVTDDLKIPQRQVSLTIDIKNQVNICLPEGDFEDDFDGKKL
jgi:hypothetical protein